MGCCHIWGYSVCLCPIKGTPGLKELTNDQCIYQLIYYVKPTNENSCFYNYMLGWRLCVACMQTKRALNTCTCLSVFSLHFCSIISLVFSLHFCSIISLVFSLHFCSIISLVFSLHFCSIISLVFSLHFCSIISLVFSLHFCSIISLVFSLHFCSIISLVFSLHF